MQDLRAWARTLQRQLDKMSAPTKSEEKKPAIREHRRFPRITLDEPKKVRYILRNAEYQGLLMDISKGGLRMQGPGHPMEGMLIAIDVPSIRTVVEAGATYAVRVYLLVQVVRAQPAGDDSWDIRCKLISRREERELVTP